MNTEFKSLIFTPYITVKEVKSKYNIAGISSIKLLLLLFDLNNAGIDKINETNVLKCGLFSSHNWMSICLNDLVDCGCVNFVRKRNWKYFYITGKGIECCEFLELALNKRLIKFNKFVNDYNG